MSVVDEPDRPPWEKDKPAGLLGFYESAKPGPLELVVDVGGRRLRARADGEVTYLSIEDIGPSR